MSIEDLRTELDEEDNIDPIEDNQEDENQEDPEETQDESNQSDDETSEDEEFVITVGDEEPEPSDDDDFSGKPAPTWVKDLRKSSWRHTPFRNITSGLLVIPLSSWRHTPFRKCTGRD